MGKFKIAVCQVDSQNEKQKNLQQAEEMIRENAEKGAQLIAFPENINFMGKGYRDQAERIPGETSDFFCRQAKENKVWLVTGSFPEWQENGKPKNTVLLIDPEGTIRSRYSKLHLFDVELADGSSWKESDSVTPGDEIVVADTDFGRIGLAVCYDLRFGELFRLMALQGVDLIIMPSCFTMQTGKDHWETLVRSRAIENGVYIAAPNQIGVKSDMIALGQSMIADPWGTVIARAGERVDSILAEIDTAYAETIRSQIPVLKNRRTDIYSLQPRTALSGGILKRLFRKK